MGIEAEQLQDRGVNVGDVMAVLDGVEAQLVGRAMDDPPLDPAAGHPDGEAVVVVVAAVGPLAQGVRPNSVAQTTIVSSRSPRRLRSIRSPAIGLSTWAQRPSGSRGGRSGRPRLRRHPRRGRPG